MDQDKFSDRGYKALFSHPAMVEGLMRSVVRPDFVDALDFSTLQRTSGTYVTEDFRERESDVIWELSVRGRPTYIYLLIEFQSTVDRFMALRVLTYIVLFYADLIKVKGDLQQLPPIFPIVLYSGDRRWTAPVDMLELIETPFSSMVQYLPRFQYFKVAINEFAPADAGLIDDLVGGLFLIETTTGSQLQTAVAQVIAMLKRHPDERLRRLFRLWLIRYLEKAGMTVDTSIVDLTETEGYQMLEKNVQEWKQLLLEEGEARGEAKGEAIGEARGRLRTLKETSVRLLATGMDRGQVCQILGLSTEEFDELHPTGGTNT